jgi:hypothetical protein
MRHLASAITVASALFFPCPLDAQQAVTTFFANGIGELSHWAMRNFRYVADAGGLHIGQLAVDDHPEDRARPVALLEGRRDRLIDGWRNGGEE